MLPLTDMGKGKNQKCGFNCGDDKNLYIRAIFFQKKENIIKY